MDNPLNPRSLHKAAQKWAVFFFTYTSSFIPNEPQTPVIPQIINPPQPHSHLPLPSVWPVPEVQPKSNQEVGSENWTVS